jgi:hypothetical protein
MAKTFYLSIMFKKTTKNPVFEAVSLIVSTGQLPYVLLGGFYEYDTEVSLKLLAKLLSGTTSY